MEYYRPFRKGLSKQIGSAKIPTQLKKNNSYSQNIEIPLENEILTLKLKSEADKLRS